MDPDPKALSVGFANKGAAVRFGAALGKAQRPVGGTTSSHNDDSAAGYSFEYRSWQRMPHGQ